MDELSHLVYFINKNFLEISHSSFRETNYLSLFSLKEELLSQ